MLSWNEILLRLVTASLLGGVIGLERERKNWSAGLRTHMMVCLGASLAMLVSAHGFSDVLHLKNVSLDPSRIAAQVISGIGFLGAGTIVLLKQGIIKGLTTAAGLWTVAAIGLAAGAGMYFAACITTVISLIILWMLQYIEKRVSRKSNPTELHIVTSTEADSAELIQELLHLKNTTGFRMSWNRTGDEKTIIIHLDDEATAKESAEAIIAASENSHLIKELSWHPTGHSDSAKHNSILN